ncbi:hypothetical protein HID58_063008 [Brassica napus]|uniref:Zinc knuckle CX2CX4HX4C domain-containing protein n=1 Tax=Brassica napus TaxID=3708 RepID=A0ABQ8A3M2_BRANA|nr:hypothetical protein HID58_063008 [Brassica napus]
MTISFVIDENVKRKRGKQLGEVETKDVTQGRVRVHINGLKPLIMAMDITLKGGKKKIEVEYEKIEKHCFLCHSLSHEKDLCPQKRNTKAPQSEMRGINETRALESLDAYKRLKDDRKLERGRRSDFPRRDYDIQPRHPHHPEEHRSHGGDRHRSPVRTYNSRPHYSTGDRDRTLAPSRGSHPDSGRSRSPGLSAGGVSRRLPASQRLSHEHGSVHSRLGERVWVEKSTQSQISHTPPPRPQREAMIGSQEANSSNDRRSALERLALPSNHPLPTKDKAVMPAEESPSTSRVPALLRLEPPVPTERTPLLQNGVANSESGRLQEVDIQYMEESFPVHILNSVGVPSSSRLPARERLSLPQVSPIRSLSEDRRHFASALGVSNQPLVITEPLATNEPPPLAKSTGGRAKGKGAVSKATGKRKVQEQPASKRRMVRSPLHGC